jgi:hypothetical protein
MTAGPRGARWVANATALLPRGVSHDPAHFCRRAPPRLTKAKCARNGAIPKARFVVWQKPQPDSEMGLMILLIAEEPAELGLMRET